MRIGKLFRNCLIILILVHPISKAIAFQEETHKTINREIATGTVNGFSLDAYLKNILDMPDGYKTHLIGMDASGKSLQQTISDWLGYGGEQEDRPGSVMDYIRFNPIRSFNHFHNPLKMWSEAGLNDYMLLPIVAPYPPFPIVGYTEKWYSGQSSLLWSQNSTQSVGGQWSWPSARKYLFNALTLTAKNQRDRNFTDTFRAVGQLMHLVHDSSVPEHVKNDIHVLPSFGDSYPAYEQQVEDFRKTEGAFWGRLISNPVSFDKTILDIPITNPSALVPIARIIDSNLYTGSDPAVTATTQTLQVIGLSEYTNANFVSKDTMFVAFGEEPQHSFNYPKAEDLTLWIDNGKWYLRKKGSGDTVDHMLRTSWLYWYRLKLFQGYKKYLPVGQDKACFLDYAQKLVPRAVGYSAGLLNYFFRGDIRLGYETTGTPGYVFINNTSEKVSGDISIYYDTADGSRWPLWIGTGWMDAKGDKTNTIDFIPPSDAKDPGRYIVVFRGKMGNEDNAVAGYVFQRTLEIAPPSQYIYSMVDAGLKDPQFTRVSVKIRNASTTEQLQKGTVQAVAKYKADTYDTDLIYSESETQPIDLSSNKQVEVEFNFDNDPIPIDATDLHLHVIFKGQIGSEDNAVAIGGKDISEPTPIDIFNNMDRICINGKWYVAGSTEAYNALPNSAKWWDYWAHDFKDVYIKISPVSSPSDASPTNYTFSVPSIAPGALSRMYILSDYDFVYSDYGSMAGIDPVDNFIHDGAIKKARQQGTGVRNQTEYSSDPIFCSAYGGGKTPCEAVRTSSFYLFRGVRIWGAGGVIVDGLSYPNYTDPGYIPCSWDLLKQ